MSEQNINLKQPLQGELHIQWVTADKLVLLWDITLITKKVIESYFSVCFRDLVALIRIYDVTDIIFDGKNAHHFYEVSIPLNNGQWFIKGLAANRSYIAELAVLIPTAGYFPLFRSNCLQTPNLNMKSSQVIKQQSEMNVNQLPSPKWRKLVSTYSYYED
jgi:hypothetical protein